jgi:hypothetical protein
MKKICLTMTIAVFLLICINGLQAHSSQLQLNQLELFKQFLGTWQANYGKDTVEVWDCQQYGKAFVINVHSIIKGQNNPLYINNVGFDSKEDKFKGYVLWADGTYSTWIGQYKNEKEFFVDMVDNFIPETVWYKFEMGYISPKERTWAQFNKNGVKTSEVKFIKVK